MISLLLVMAIVLPMTVSAAVEPRASAYLDNYNAYVYLPGDGEVRVYFNVQGTDDMDELGALFISRSCVCLLGVASSGAMSGTYTGSSYSRLSTCGSYFGLRRTDQSSCNCVFCLLWY